MVNEVLGFFQKARAPRIVDLLQAEKVIVYGCVAVRDPDVYKHKLNVSHILKSRSSRLLNVFLQNSDQTQMHA
jgi:hypothetical protein